MNNKISKKIIDQVNEVYKEKNPSTYIKDFDKKKIKLLIDNRKKFLLEKLHLPPRIFKNSELLDLGCGSGQNSIFYDWYGANCTLVEFDKNSFLNTKKLFKQFSQNKTTFINNDLFKFNTKKKFDFVISNGVAHHTHDIRKNISHATKFLKKDGILILGIGETNGFFQRHLQRHILFNVAKDHNDIIKISKLLFKENLLRAKKYGGRSEDEIIYDTYLNPKIQTLSFDQVQNIFNRNKLSLYSLDENEFNIENLYGNNSKQYKVIFKNKKKILNKDFFLNSIINFSLSKESHKFKSRDMKKINKVNRMHNNLTDMFNDQTPNNHKLKEIDNFLKIYKNKIKNIKKIDLIDKKNLILFLNETQNILNILKFKNNKIKIAKLYSAIKNNKKLFRKLNGKGMNYFVGIKY
jgi:SAM-dependent methyltransferase